ncbi:hypothetical protein [Afipia felis]|uniref:Uncharacterized protein n=2 Tax=Afipia felis TaxID=1035 RepID=A0A381AZ27_AFIFE|nr:hypothetical protein [Afipia felis]EKS26732.1 hypothetical protein HMPREF9697_03990 [Afipia felis ATCC 53690]SUU76173.1 Uncharacterised protein [Afipia felis]SUU84240.1 Uncharacterised protein [Afipia felis]SUW28271.1 Uncharacterised protein [Afipia felis]
MSLTMKDLMQPTADKAAYVRGFVQCLTLQRCLGLLDLTTFFALLFEAGIGFPDVMRSGLNEEEIIQLREWWKLK